MPGIKTKGMAQVTPSEEFKRIAAEVSSTGTPRPMTKNELRAYFGDFSKIGRQIKDDISRHLRKLKVTTEPSFRGKKVKEFMLIKSRPRSAPAPTDAGQEPPAIVPDMDENGGDLSELTIANKVPSFVHRNAEPEVLFQMLVESGKRGIVLVVERVDSSPRQGQQEQARIRNAIGVVTWESFARAMIGAPGNMAGGSVQLPRPEDAMDRDIALAYGTDDLIQSLQRIDKKGVLVILNNSDKSVTGIATRRDIYSELSEDLLPYYIVSLIENMLRIRIEEAEFSKEDLRKISKSAEVESVEDLEFSQYISFFETKEHFSKIKAHGVPSEMGALLHKIRALRNQLMHFNQEDEVDYTGELLAHYEALRKLLNED